MKKLLTIFLIIPAALLLLVTLMGFTSSTNGISELFSHFRILFSVTALLFLLISIPCKSKALSILTTISLLINFSVIAPLYMPAPAIGMNDMHHVKIMQFNLWGGKNRKYVAVVQSIIEANPDIIGFSEVTPTWLTALKAGLVGYPYSVATTIGGGIAIFSRIPFETKEIRYYSEKKRPRALSTIKLADGHFTFLMVHPFIPLKSLTERNDEFVLYAKEAIEGEKSGPVVIAGDFNCTPWSSYFSKLLADGNLIDTEQGFGPQPTWSNFHKIAFFPIDHCLVSKNVFTSKRTIGADIGSDHLPVIVDLEMKVTH